MTSKANFYARLERHKPGAYEHFVDYLVARPDGTALDAIEITHAVDVGPALERAFLAFAELPRRESMGGMGHGLGLKPAGAARLFKTLAGA